MTEGVHRWEESRVFHQRLLSPLGMGAENKRHHQKVCSGAGDETEGLNLEDQGEM